MWCTAVYTGAHVSASTCVLHGHVGRAEPPFAQKKAGKLFQEDRDLLLCPISHQTSIHLFFSLPHTVSSRHAPSSSLTRLNNTSHQRCSADIQLATSPRVNVRPPYLAEPMAAHEGKVRLRLAIERKRREGRPIFTRAECPQP